MINIKLNDNTADDVKYILELQAMGVPDDVIQAAYDRAYGERKDNESKAD